METKRGTALKIKNSLQRTAPIRAEENPAAATLDKITFEKNECHDSSLLIQ